METINEINQTIYWLLAEPSPLADSFCRFPSGSSQRVWIWQGNNPWQGKAWKIYFSG
jgi:hypothetical protein